MNILIVGVGAIGSALLAFLTKSGNRVQGLLREGRPELKYIEVEGIWGNFKVDVSTTSHLREVNTPDLVILSVKSFDTEEALRRIKPVVSERTFILIAQNGYGNYEKAVEIYGEERVILSRIIFGAKRESRNKVRITVSADDVIVGNPSPKVNSEKVKEVVEILKKSGIPTRYERDVYKYLWDKIIYNSALNPLGALLEVNYGYLAQNSGTRSIIDNIVKEIFCVLDAKGIETFWNKAEDYLEHFYNRLVPPTAEHYPSMLEDIKKGKTEIDSLNGAIINLGDDFGLETPVNRTVVGLIKAKEQLYSEVSKS